MSFFNNFHLLLIEDDPLTAEAVKLILPKNWKLTWIPEFRKLNAKFLFHAAVVDMHLTNNLNIAEGVGCIEELRQQNLQLKIMAYSGDLSRELMESCLRAGADRFLAKPLVAEEFLAQLEKIEAYWMIRKLESSAGKNHPRWIGNSPAAEEVRKTLANLMNEEGPILIEGETGTGKEVCFRILNSQQSSRPSISLNVAGISENLFESEMFGHVRGAFTGAETQKIGLCEAAHGGDLFLDEVEALSLQNQVKLLRFLESGEVRKVGAKETQFVNTRVIAASNKNLEGLTKDGKFREDLFFRLAGKRIKLPPLRQRPTDIETLFELFLSESQPRTNKQLSPEALKALQSYPWPGNVRELKRICEQLAVSAPLPIIREEDILGILGAHSTDNSGYKIDLRKGFGKLVEEFEILIIKEALAKYLDVDSAAQALSISRSSLYKKIKDYSIEE